jgi:hypothetical protein
MMTKAAVTVKIDSNKITQWEVNAIDVVLPDAQELK